jgi:hypothetical protein
MASSGCCCISGASWTCAASFRLIKIYWSFSCCHHQTGIICNSILQSPESATNLVPSWRKCTHSMGLFLPGCIVQCRCDCARSAAGAHFAGPLPLSRSSLLWRPATPMSMLLEAVIVAAPPFILPLGFLPPITLPPTSSSPSPPPLPCHGHFCCGGHCRRHPLVA